jgi:hypothetical protein
MLYTPGSKATAEFRAFAKPSRRLIAKSEKATRSPEPELAPKSESAPVVNDPLIEQLLKFGVLMAKARALVERHREAAEAQIAAYPYREERKPKKNAAGWLIAAIENNYTLPVAYLEKQAKKREAVSSNEARAATERCNLCDLKGWRRVRTSKYPDGAMKRCSHNPDIEGKYPSV